MMQQVKHFPPGRGYVKVPVTSRADALAGLALYSATRPAARRAQRAAWLMVQSFGPRALPGRTHAWMPPFDSTLDDPFEECLRGLVGDFDAVAAYEPRQRERTGFCLLLRRAGRSIGFVKVRRSDDARLPVERAALACVARSRPTRFRAPAPMAIGRIGPWQYLLTEPLPPVIHHVPWAPPLAEIAGEVAAALDGMRPPEETPAHWRPMHGDFTPWNLRDARGTLYLVDWEDVRYGPPHADEVYYRAADAALRGETPVPTDAQEAARYWRDRVAARARSDSDDRLRTDLLAALDAMCTDAPAADPAEPEPATP